jgi:putative aldouronate transport system permease protein
MMASTYKTVPRKRHYSLQEQFQRIKKVHQLYLLLVIPIVYLVIFQYYPMYGAQIAFKSFKANLGIIGSPWVGFKHFIRFFKSYQFVRVVSNTFILSSYSLICAFTVRVILALMINIVRSGGYRKTVQMVTYMPHFISTVVLVGILVQFFNPRLGVISMFIQLLGGTNRDLMGMPQFFAHIYVWSGIWQNAGWGTIIFLAALSSVDTNLYEAAIIDGTNRLQRVWHIDIPTIIPTAIILLILDAGRIMNVGFEKVFLMQNDLNLSASEVISTYVYKVGIGGTGGNVRTDFSFGAAIGLFNSVINFILVFSVNSLSRMMNQNSLW